jgi:Mg/Co/Ni transporter MgtE
MVVEELDDISDELVCIDTADLLEIITDMVDSDMVSAEEVAVLLSSPDLFSSLCSVISDTVPEIIYDYIYYCVLRELGYNMEDFSEGSTTTRDPI